LTANKFIFQGVLGASTACIFYALNVQAVVDFKVEGKLNFRYSEARGFPVELPLPADVLPDDPAETALTTVDPNAHVEVSNLTLLWHWQTSENTQFRLKVDAIDLYEKNPTSTDLDINLDWFFFRYGTKHTQGKLPQATDYYFQFGKFGKFERQEDRHLESYGLVSTAFNRLEDSGLETGIDFTSGFYSKLSWTTGNPVFIRDPNALAGDNGINRNPPSDSGSKYNSGIVILYDAEVEDLDLQENPELGLALGKRWINETGENRVNLMLFHYQRDMADSVDLHGTDYGGDLDLLDLSEAMPGVTLPITHTDKKESGANIWWYKNQLSLFGQYVTQDIAGLKRNGWELELATAFDLPGQNQLVDRIIPVVRYSDLNIQFAGHPLYPAPSVFWDWEKLDLGVNLVFNDKIKLIMEHASNRFIRAGRKESNDEFLFTLVLRCD